MDKNGNENCLEGYACPKCGHHEMLQIAAVSHVEVYDDGTGEHCGWEWDENSHCTCPKCGFADAMGEFLLKEETHGLD